MFKAIVYGMALQGIMVNSLMKWNTEYLYDLREKFVQQEYPLKLINGQFRRALSVNREDLLLRTPSIGKRKRKVICPLVVTYNPANPPFKLWIKNYIDILHKDENLKSFVPNIKKRIMRNKYGNNVDQSNSIQPAGNLKYQSW